MFNPECAQMRVNPVIVTKEQMERGIEKYNILYNYETGGTTRRGRNKGGCACTSAYVSQTFVMSEFFLSWLSSSEMFLAKYDQ